MGRQKKRNGRCCDDYDDNDYNFYYEDREQSCGDDYCSDFYEDC